MTKNLNAKLETKNIAYGNKNPNVKYRDLRDIKFEKGPLNNI